MLREKLRNRKGFTLIEIIVVIVILAVLMAVAVPSVMSYMKEGDNAKYESIARTVLVRTQADVAKGIAQSSTAVTKDTVVTDNSFKIDGSTSLKSDVEGEHYGDGVSVELSKVTLSGTDDDIDVSSVQCKIKLTNDRTAKDVIITANKKVTIS